MKTKFSKRFFSLLLALIMVCSIIPTGIITASAATFDPVWPCQNAWYVTCMYYYKTGAKHSTRYGYTNAMDIAGGGNILATESGTVETATTQDGGFGKYVVIKHSNGYRSLYGHMSSISVSTGQTVSKGQVIGVMGSTGNSSGTHLHFEYSGADPWKSYFNSKYYSKMMFEQNVRSNNSSYNSDKTIVNIIDANYKLSSGYYRYNSGDPSTITNPSYTKDTKYPTPFKCRIISTTKVPAYYSINGDSPGYIYPEDDCVIQEVYTNGWCRLDCPWSDGTTKTLYCKITEFIKMNITPSTVSAPQYAKTYLRTSKDINIGWIDAGDSITKLATSGSMTQIVYPADSGKRCAWVDTSSLTSSTVDKRYPTPFKCRTISTSNVVAYGSVNGAEVGHIYPGDDCVIKEVYTNGWCRLDCPWEGNTTKTVYCKITEFVKMNITPEAMKAPAYAKTYLRTDKATNIGWIDTGDSITKLATSGSMTMIVYPADVGYRCAWVDTSALASKLSVYYNANGGTITSDTYKLSSNVVYETATNAKYVQTWTYNSKKTNGLTNASTFGLSRTGYTFVGWGTSANGGTVFDQNDADLLPTDINKNVANGNCSATLYAKWAPITYSIKYNANGGNGSLVESSHTYDTAKILSSNTFEKVGYHFVGWATSATATTAKYTDEQSVKNLTSTKNGTINLYAVWAKNAYTVKYNANGGVGTMADSAYTYDTAKALTANTFTRDGYKFLGWSTTAAATTPAYTDKQSVKNLTSTNGGTITLYAVWEKEAAPITVTSISVQNMPSKTVYEIGESFNTSGLKLKLTYSDGSTEVISTGFTTSGFSSSTVGTKTITVNYGGKTTSFTVTVNEKEIETDEPQYKITGATVVKGSRFTVNLMIENNPGIVSLRNMISYDENALTLVSVEDKKLLNGYTIPSPVISSPYTLRWTDSLATENNQSNGTIAVLTFEVNDTAALGDYQITVTPVESRNSTGSKIEFKEANATITVTDVVLGDVDNDGEVTDWDAILLNRYLAGWKDITITEEAADVDCDGEISDWDAIMLERYLAGWPVKFG